MTSLTTLTATSSFDRLVAPGQPVRHTVTSTREARPLGHRGSRFTALSWFASSVVVATLLGGVMAGISVPPQQATAGSAGPMFAKTPSAKAPATKGLDVANVFP